MLLQASLPRPLVKMDEFPANLVVLTLARGGVSNGSVTMGFMTDTESGERARIDVEAARVFPIDGEDGFQAFEYILPVDRLVAAHGNLSIVYGTVGVEVFVRSAYRSSAAAYAEHRIGFSAHFPITGGGYIRMWNAPFDMGNPGFDPKATTPSIGSANEEARLPGQRMATENMVLAFNRTHKVERNTDLVTLRRRIRTGQVAPTPENLMAAGLDPDDASSYPLGRPVETRHDVPRLPAYDDAPVGATVTYRDLPPGRPNKE